MPDTRYPGPESIKRHVLPNGITVLAYENFAGESIVVEGLLRAGALFDPPEQAGLADFTSDLLMRGTVRRDFDQIYEELESVGAGLGFGSGRHTTRFSGYALAEDVELLLDLLGEGLRRPTFPEREVEKVRGQIMTGLQMRANNTQQMANLLFLETLFKGHPYGRSVSGYVETVPNISRDDIARFHAQTYGPRDMIVAVVGALPAEAAVEAIARVFGDWDNPQQAQETAVPEAILPAEPEFSMLDMPRKSQSDIVLGVLGPSRAAPDYLHASLANSVLGVFGMMGRIGQNVRERQGLAYYAYSRLSGGLGPTPWMAGAGVEPQNVTQAIDSIVAELERLRSEPVPAEELADSQAYRTGSMPVGLETNSGLAGVFVDMELYDLGFDYLQRFPDLINAITAEDVQAVAQKYLTVERLVTAVAGPQAAEGQVE